VLQSLVRRLPGTWGNSCWLSRSQKPDAMSDSLLAAEAGSSGSAAWDYRSTFAQPTVIKKARQSPRKLLFRTNPLGLNPVKPESEGARTPSPKSFVSFFHWRSAASTRRSSFRPFLQGQSGSVIDPQSPLPPNAAPPFARPSAMSGRSTELRPSDTNGFSRPLTMPPQLPPLALQLPWHNRDSQITMTSTESEARSIKSAPGWLKFHYPHRSRNGDVPQGPGKALPPPSLPIPPGSRDMAEVLHRSHSTTTSEDEKGHHMESDCDSESAGTKQAVFGPSEWKQVQIGQRISGASASSLVAEKQKTWQI
jgi:hypothetical protein